MNVLVAGAYGFIGKRLIARLAKRHDSVVAVDCFECHDCQHPQIRHQVLDLDHLDHNSLSGLFGGEDFSVVNLVWHNPRENSYATAAQSVAQMANLLEHVKDRAQKVISLGSADEYGTQEGCLSPDSESSGCLSPYGWGKKCARELMQNWSLQRNIPALWLRPFTVYGDGQRGNMLLPYAIKQAEAGQKAGFSDGLQQRDFIHVDDVIDAIILALNSGLTGFHAINLGCGKPVPVKDVLDYITDMFNAGHLFEYGVVPRRTDEPNVRFADIAAAKELLQWTPTIELEEGLLRIARAHMDAAGYQRKMA